ncbi:DgyrCDS4802 [Dimorphilus gyrociliatus]|uniref:DgyrCDS4802 n=1 Tax=Dimorphilus gyrociliatus TaxID=2664684 RepID=A0A7I8VI33_9ANNE|nr:DgyrCDS4802 [Dimorphilus gyrociliatus]
MNYNPPGSSAQRPNCGRWNNKASASSRNSLETRQQAAFPGHSYGEFHPANNNLNWYDNPPNNFMSGMPNYRSIPPPQGQPHQEFRGHQPGPPERVFHNPLPENMRENVDISLKTEEYPVNRMYNSRYDQELSYRTNRNNFSYNDSYYVNEKKKYWANPLDSLRLELEETPQQNSKANALRAVYEELQERANSPPKHLPPDISAAPKRSILKKTSTSRQGVRLDEEESFLYGSTINTPARNLDSIDESMCELRKKYEMQKNLTFGRKSNTDLLNNKRNFSNRPTSSTDNQSSNYSESNGNEESAILQNIFQTIGVSSDIQNLVEKQRKKKLAEKEEFKIKQTSSTFMDGGLFEAIESKGKFAKFLPEDGETYEERARKYKEIEKEKEDIRLSEVKKKIESRKLEEKISQRPTTSEKNVKDIDIKGKDEPTLKEIRIDPVERNRLLEKHKERIKHLELAELELDRCRRTQVEWMRKKQRSKIGVDEGIIAENERLQKSMIDRINLLRKEADDLSRRIGLEDASEMKTVEFDKKCSNNASEEESKRKKSKTEYDFIDVGNHWCRLCNTVSVNVYELFNHLKTKEHAENADPFDRPWLPEHLKNQKVEKKRSSTKAPFKGVEFMMPVNAFYCKLCDEFAGDHLSAEDHLKSSDHNERFRLYLQENPLYEKQYHLEKAVNLAKWKRKKEDEERKEIRQDILKNRNDIIIEKKADEKRKIIVENKNDSEKSNKPDVSFRTKIITGKIPGIHNDRKRKLLIPSTSAKKGKSAQEQKVTQSSSSLSTPLQVPSLSSSSSSSSYSNLANKQKNPKNSQDSAKLSSDDMDLSN